MPSGTPTETILIGLALVAFAGLCAPLGATIVLFMKPGQTFLLVGAIGMAAGVMIFVSLAEILPESQGDLEKWGLSPPAAQALAYTCFVGGIPVCYVLDWLARWCVRVAVKQADGKVDGCAGHDVEHDHAHGHGVPALTKEDIIREAERDREIADGNLDDKLGAKEDGSAPSVERASGVAVSEDVVEVPQVCCTAQAAAAASRSPDLLKTGAMVFLSMFLHNLPEGLATFVAYCGNPRSGLTMAIAIALHNIPEGFAVGVPVFFATGSRWKAIAWAAASGVAEPIGALIGVAVVASGSMNALAIGMTLGLVAGIMTAVSFWELIPSALLSGQGARWAVPGIFAGMVVMAVSLVLLGLWKP
ncbi:Zinc/iron permease [Hyaloraphidium curvatum]|nr:Zinc/iron permease [Hyaloraphidium curvatum]